jgi:cytochrome d ubiquinol oxidase subunit II
MLAGFVAAEMLLARLPGRADRFSWLPFVLTVALFLLMLSGLAYSLFPYLILDDMTLWDGAGALGSMRLVMAGAVVGIPVVLVFNILAYRSVFGKERRRVPLLPPPSYCGSCGRAARPQRRGARAGATAPAAPPAAGFLRRRLPACGPPRR